jgi:tryptophan synthase alpha chain
MAFMPFITAGDPDLSMTQNLIGELAARGVDLIEVGFPYSDPIADGPVIQASYTRALAKRLHVNEIFAAVREMTQGRDEEVRRWGDKEKNSEPNSATPHPPTSSPPHPHRLPPLVAMVAYAIIYRLGSETFVCAARDAGFAGLIVPDLPADEASDLSVLTRAHGLDLIQLIAPTTTKERTRRILDTATGFLYCISVAGTTGVRDRLPAELRDQLRWLKTQTDLPLAVGFGISRPEQVEELRGLADGIIVGSALVKHVGAIAEQGASPHDAVQNVGALASAMVAATHGAAK